MKLLLYRETRWPVPTSKMREKTPPGRTTLHTPLVKTNQSVSQQMEHWNWLKCVNITYRGNIM